MFQERIITLGAATAHRRPAARHLACAMALLAALPGTASAVPRAADDFVVDDRLVSNPASDLPQPEFDPVRKRMFWQDAENQLWLAQVDPDTGAITPPDGRLLLIDSGLAPVNEVGNTPRISYGAEDVLIYTRREGTQNWLAVARNPEPGLWLAQLLTEGQDRFRANGTPPEYTGVARMVYNRQLPDGETVVAWREWDAPGSEVTAQNVIGQGGRFLGDEPQVLTLQASPQGLIQVYLIDLATGIGEPITTGPPNKLNPFIWRAPEFDDWAIVMMLGFSELAVYRRENGIWSEYTRFTIPSEKPLLSSPEAFAHNGRSYISVVTADELGTGDVFPGQPVGPSEIWLAGIDPSQPFFRRIDDASRLTQKAEPEPYPLTSGPVVYYTEKVPGSSTRRLRMAATGLGPAKVPAAPWPVALFGLTLLLLLGGTVKRAGFAPGARGGGGRG